MQHAKQIAGWVAATMLVALLMMVAAEIYRRRTGRTLVDDVVSRLPAGLAGGAS